MAQSSSDLDGPLFWNPFDPAVREDPYPTYRRLREAARIHRNPLGMSILTRHADCVAVLRDRRMSSDQTRPEIRQELLAKGFPDREPAARPFLFMDPPEHTRMRSLVSKAFNARVVESLRPRIQELVDSMVGRALERGEMELVSELAYPLPVKVISELLGVPSEDHERFKAWSDALARGLDPEILLSPQEIADRDRAVEGFRDYFAGLIAARRQHPGEDLLSGLVQVEEQGEGLSEEDLFATGVLLLVAGHETTVNLIGNGVLALVRHPDQLDLLRRDPGLVKSAVEELLRFDPPVQLTMRLALEDLEVAGEPIAKGDPLILLLASANHDPEVFDHPERLDLARQDNRHLAFGLGAHFCLGAPLARLEAQIAIGTLVARAGHLRLAGPPPRRKDNLVLRGLESLHLEVAPA
jgi:cytochrome P450